MSYEYYRYWHEFYSSNTGSSMSDASGDISDVHDILEDLLGVGWVSFLALVDGVEKQVLLFHNAEPSDSETGEVDSYIINTELSCFHMGSIIEIPLTGEVFMVETIPDWNGAYLKARVQPMPDVLSLYEGVQTPAILYDKLFADDISATNEANVFDDLPIYGVKIPYNAETSQLKVLDKVMLNDKPYTIGKIDLASLKEYNEDFGVSQLSLVESLVGDLYLNGEELRGMITFERVKDLFTNSTSRALYNDYALIKKGDYVEFTFDRDEQGTMETETYLVVNRPVKNIGYDKSLLYLCESVMKLIDDSGEIVEIPISFDNNRTRIDKTTENEYLILQNSSFAFSCQSNVVTELLRYKVKRIIINGDAYKITGTSPHGQGLLSFGVKLDQITDDDNMELGVANYYSRLEEIEREKEPILTDEIIGYAELYKGYANEYYLQRGITYDWSCDKSWVSLSMTSDDKCSVIFDALEHIDETIILYATFNGVTYSREIKTGRIGEA